MDRSRKVEEIIEHYGVKGMRWGVRKSRSQLRKEASVRKKREPSEESIEVSNLKRKKGKELSNAELQKAVKRMELERKYNSLNEKGISKGLTRAQKQVGVLLALGTTVNGVIAFVNSPAGKAIATTLKKSSKATV